jgi:hypothetical protein
MHSISDDLHILDGEAISVPEVETSAVGGMVDDNILYRNTLVRNVERCLNSCISIEVYVLNGRVITLRSLGACHTNEVATCRGFDTLESSEEK